MQGARGEKESLGIELAPGTGRASLSVPGLGGSDPLKPARESENEIMGMMGGDNTGSIEPGLFSEPTMSRNATFMRSSTLDDELSRRGLGDAEVLILKIDVEGQ